MDAAGKQELHIGSYSSKTCSCPKRLAAGTVDSYIGKLRSIFNRLGRTGFSNRLAHPCVKEYNYYVCKRGASSATFVTLSVCPFVLLPIFAGLLPKALCFLLSIDTSWSEI